MFLFSVKSHYGFALVECKGTCVKHCEAVVQERQGTMARGLCQLVAAAEAIWENHHHQQQHFLLNYCILSFTYLLLTPTPSPTPPDPMPAAALTWVNTPDAVVHDKQGTSGRGLGQLVAAREAIWRVGLNFSPVFGSQSGYGHCHQNCSTMTTIDTLVRVLVTQTGMTGNIFATLKVWIASGMNTCAPCYSGCSSILLLP